MSATVLWKSDNIEMYYEVRLSETSCLTCASNILLDRNIAAKAAYMDPPRLAMMF